MKSFHYAALWLALWLAGVVAILVVSLGSPPPAPGVPAADKWMHLVAYSGIAIGAVQVFRAGRPLVWVALGLVAMGVGLEVAQGTLIEGRTMDWRDALANTLGVAIGAALAEVPGRDLLMALDNRIARAVAGSA